MVDGFNEFERGEHMLAEQTLIGDIVQIPDKVMPAISGIVNAEDFSYPIFSELYAAATKLYREQKSIDALTLCSEAGDPKRYKDAVYRAWKMSTSPSNCRAHAQIVADNSKRRRAAEEVRELDGILSTGGDIGECREVAARVIGCLEERGQEREVSAAKLFFEYLERLEKAEPVEYIKTGFGDVDRRTHISRGDYVIVAGRPSSGKTALTLQWALKAARRNRVVYFSLETQPKKIIERMVACKAQIELERIKTLTLNEREKDEIESHGQDFKEMELFVVPAAGWTVEQVRAKTAQLRADIVFIDYLGLLRGKGESSYERVSKISSDLHVMAQSMGVLVVALAQLNRMGTGEPDMTHLRDSGQIEQDADVIFILDTPERDKNGNVLPDRSLYVVKNKDGECGKKRMIFDGAKQTFCEVSDREI